ncbi:MAG: hypothetical protein JWM21_762 [Acidobacteria bacterium]|nr:hypothetical protein [Acidobacteriota bacterium]
MILREAHWQARTSDWRDERSPVDLNSLISPTSAEQDL